MPAINALNTNLPLQVQVPNVGNALNQYDAGQASVLKQRNALVEEDLRRAQAEYYRSGGQSGGASVYGTPIYGVDPATGETVLGAMGKDGSFQRLDTGGVIPTPGVSFQNLGTSVQPFSSKTGAPVAPPTPIDVSGEKSAEAQGKAQGEAAAGLSNTLARSEQAISTIDGLLKHPGLGTATGTSGALDPRNYIPGTEAYDFQIALKQAQGQVFLDAYERLKGGGVITEIEGQKAEQAIARLDRGQSDAEFKKGLKDLREVIVAGQSRAKQRAGAVPGTASAPGNINSGELNDIQKWRSDPRIQKAQQILQMAQQRGVPEAQAEADVMEAMRASGVPDQVIQMLQGQ